MSQRLDILDMIVPDDDIVALQLFETGQHPQRVMVVVEDGDLHPIDPRLSVAAMSRDNPARPATRRN